MYFRLLFLFTLICSSFSAFCQQDMDLHITDTYLSGKNILKVKRDYKDAYLWVLAQNNEIYRINSLTKAVEDYTSQFASYNNQRFIDLAGASADTLFVVAANSNQVLEYKKGAIQIIGPANGIPGIVNSVGIANSTYDFYNKTAFFATDHGLCMYDYAKEIMQPIRRPIDSKIWESSYRNQIIHGYENCRCDPDTVNQYGVFDLLLTIYGADLYLGGKSFGNTIKTVYTTNSNPHDPANFFIYWGAHLWATENGLFQRRWDRSNYSGAYPTHFYLKGVQINKISSIYGLLSLGSASYRNLLKENILVGSTQGLYFSNSQMLNAPEANYSFFHFDALGNKNIHDICVNADSYNLAPYSYGSSFIKTTTGTICENGIWIAADDGLYFITPDYGPYIDQTQKMRALSFSGKDYNTTEVQICASDSVSIVLNSGVYNSNLINWFKNGTEIPDQHNTKLSVREPGEYNAIVYDPCSGIHLETNHLKIATIAAPVFTFNYPDKLYYCSGSAATLQTENNPNYQYRWYKDGTLNGLKTASLNITDAGKYKLEVSGCSGNWVSTKEVEVNFIKLPQPSVSADKSAYCIGDQSTLTVNTPLDDSYDINWYLNGTVLNADQNKTSIVTDKAGSYTVNISSKLASCNQVSLSYSLSFESAPTLSIQKIVNTTLCDGQSVTLKATYSGGTIKWSTGETTDQINTKQTGIYTAMVSTAAGCTVSKDISVQFFSNPVLNMPDASLCQFTNQTITLSAPAGFAKYEWNGQTGTSTYVTGALGKVILKVTDNNGCTATQTINISSHCDDIHIPNTFTPNGDGINDKWEIAGLQGDESTIIKVYNRYGELVFQSTGYTVPWEGTYKGKKLPTGVYYYVVNARGSNKVISGNLSIIY